jgi:uncharacterized membrane protein YphA (DoxX/SURF4 family)
MTGTDRPFAGLPYLAALVLAAVFALAAAAKWRDLPGTARAMATFGLPRPWLVARIVPGVEAALALGLVLTPAASAVVALALLSAFTVLVVLRLRGGGAGTPCGCFGSWGRSTLSWVDVMRNGLLVVTALIAIAGDLPRRPGIGALALTLAVLAASGVVFRRLRM